MGLIDAINTVFARRRMKQGAEAANSICTAAATGDMAALKKYFKDTPKGDPGRIGDYAFVEACGAGQVEAARFLLDLGVKPDVVVASNMTAEEEAAKGEHLDIILLLSEYRLKAGLPLTPLMEKAQALVEAQKTFEVTKVMVGAPVLQRDINVREKPLKLKTPRS